MRLEELKVQVLNIIESIKNNGNYPKENNIIDYKFKLNIDSSQDEIENLFKNLAKDIISFSNGDGGIILIGFEEDKYTTTIKDTGLDADSIKVLEKIDLNLVIQKFDSITKGGVNIDLQKFNIGTRIFFYLLIEKQTNILVPQNDFTSYKLKKGDIYYRKSGKNEHANKSTTDFNTFLQIKANEKNKEFMDIWSKLLPEMFDINPREVLILNPKSNKVYGYNAKDNLLSSSEIEIDQDDNGIFNIILNAISAGDIGKISNDEGKPIYKIVGELKVHTPRNFIWFSSLVKKVKENCNFTISSEQFKMCFKFLKWVNVSKFKIENPDNKLVINEIYNNYIWLETLEKTKKVVFSEDAQQPLIDLINDKEKHIEVFGKELNIKS